MRVAIRVDDDGNPVVSELKLLPQLTLYPGDCGEVEGTEWAVKNSLARGTIVVLGEGESPPEPQQKQPYFLE